MGVNNIGITIVGVEETFDSTAQQKIITTNHKLKSIIDDFLKKYKNWEFSITILITLIIASLTTDFIDVKLDNEIIFASKGLDYILYSLIAFFTVKSIFDIRKSNKYNCKYLIERIRDTGQDIN